METIEAIFTGNSGSKIVITRYGQDDYSAWWTDDAHMQDETYGYSTRGTLSDVMDEVRDDLPPHHPVLPNIYSSDFGISDELEALLVKLGMMKEE